MKIIIIILQAILNLVRKRRDLIANRSKIPPEYRDDVVVWYSPKKQRLTNYDVIESYAEDFTYWTINNTSITSAQKKIVIPAGTELEYVIAYRGFNASTDGFDIKYTGNIAITYRYNKEDGTVGTIAIDKSGIYHLPASVRAQKNFGFYCNPQTVTEEATIEQLPTSILKDFSGNRHDAYLYGFKGRLNSGVGIYAQDFTKWIFGSAIHNISTKAHNKLHIVKKNPNNYFGYTIGIQKANYYNKPYKLKFNFNKEIDDINFSVVSTDGNLIITKCFSAIINNGSVVDVPIISEEIFNNQKEPKIYYDFGTNKDIEIDVELIPDYPNQLCYDGKSYGVAYDMPILTDYTIIAKRKWLNVNKGTFIVYGNPLSGGIENSAFGFEYINAGAQKLINTFGNSKILDNFYEGDISFMTPTNYNGNNKAKGSTPNTKNTLAIGNYTDTTQYGFIGCHDDIIILKRSLTINEINDITKAIFNETIIEEQTNNTSKS